MFDPMMFLLANKEKKTTRWKDVGVKVADKISHSAFLQQRYAFRRHHFFPWKYQILRMGHSENGPLFTCVFCWYVHHPSVTECWTQGMGTSYEELDLCGHLENLDYGSYSYTNSNPVLQTIFFYLKSKCFFTRSAFKAGCRRKLSFFSCPSPPTQRTLVMNMQEFDTLRTKRILLGK